MHGPPGPVKISHKRECGRIAFMFVGPLPGRYCSDTPLYEMPICVCPWLCSTLFGIFCRMQGVYRNEASVYICTWPIVRVRMLTRSEE